MAGNHADTLRRFGLRPEAQPDTVIQEAEEEAPGYRAFKAFADASGKPMLDLRSHDGGQLIPYGHLLRVRYDGEEAITLVLPDSLITIEGQHLGELRRLLQSHRADFVQEYDAQRWPEPPAEGAPLVRKIVPVAPGLLGLG